MPIEILPDDKIKTVKFYFLGFFDRKIIDETFDKLHTQKRMEFTTQPTFYKYPIVVFWRTIRKTRKKLIITNIRGFNKITVINFILCHCNQISQP